LVLLVTMFCSLTRADLLLCQMMPIRAQTLLEEERQGSSIQANRVKCRKMILRRYPIIFLFPSFAVSTWLNPSNLTGKTLNLVAPNRHNYPCRIIPAGTTDKKETAVRAFSPLSRILDDKHKEIMVYSNELIVRGIRTIEASGKP
jgi:hypothetical protein